MNGICGGKSKGLRTNCVNISARKPCRLVFRCLVIRQQEDGTGEWLVFALPDPSPVITGEEAGGRWLKSAIDF